MIDWNRLGEKSGKGLVVVGGVMLALTQLALCYCVGEYLVVAFVLAVGLWLARRWWAVAALTLLALALMSAYRDHNADLAMSKRHARLQALSEARAATQPAELPTTQPAMMP